MTPGRARPCSSAAPVRGGGRNERARGRDRAAEIMDPAGVLCAVAPPAYGEARLSGGAPQWSRT
ncbi:hypothetical protein [Streptomyces inhibens]|uniref:hypothetical protein n=1 Tax=Streptomyces inhibens TaxID=2293571 RepID=UPI001EE774E1|nr:hypothetical protein [Streptomyces inhibens]UKY50188.1 hypothetical protein KI385_16065 [Streptomyces inhibens]